MKPGGVFAAAARDARDAWRPLTTLVALAFAVAAFAPLVVGESRVADLAGGLYLAAAAVGLAFTVGVAGLPLLAQGAFVAIGAVAAAHIGSTALGAVAGALAGAAAGVVIGAAFARLPPAGFAAASWIVSWLVAFALQSIHWLLGGTQGIVVAAGPSPSEHYELALLLTLLAVLAYAALARAPIGLQLAAAREREPAAAALHMPIVRLRTRGARRVGPRRGPRRRSRRASRGCRGSRRHSARFSRSSSSSSS